VNPQILRAWLDFIRAAAGHFKGRVRYYEIWDAPNREPLWAPPHLGDYAYLLKNSSVTVRSVDPEALVVEGGLEVSSDTLEADRAWQDALYQEEIATYVDVLAVHPSVDVPLERALPRLYDLLLQHDPSAQLWITRVPVHGEDDKSRAADLLSRFIVAQGEGASMVSFDLEADVEGRADLPGVLLDIHKLFIPTYSRVPATRIAFEPFDEGTAGRIEGIKAYQFFDSNAFQGLVGFFAPQPFAAGKARLVLDTAAVRGVGVYDIVGGAAGPIRNVRPDFKSNTTRVPVFVYDRPQILQYARVAIQGFEAEKEQIDIKESGLFTAEEFVAACKPRGHPIYPPTTLVEIENTHNRAGGVIFPQAEAVRICAAARERSIATFLDGARLWNTAIASGRTLSELAAPFELVAVSLSKGLGAPGGSLLAGLPDLIERAIRQRRMLGGAMRQVGIMAAAGLHALDHHMQRLADDHANARRFGERLVQSRRLLLDLATVQTNIIVFSLSPDAPDAATVVARARERGVLVFAFGARTIRAVTHLDVTREQCAAAAQILVEVVEGAV